MAPMSAINYFPPLDKCLSREELLISWKSVHSAITAEIQLEDGHQETIQYCLKDDKASRMVTDPFNAYPKPTAQSKNDFETKTSAINVTPSSDSHYDIKEIKEDAIWLSTSVGIDEVSALRVAVQEFQSRAAAQLRGPFSEEELGGIRDAAGNSTFSRTAPSYVMRHGPDAQEIQREFSLQRSRRRRILCAYLSERRYVLKCSGPLLSIFFRMVESCHDNGKEIEEDAFYEIWLSGPIRKEFSTMFKENANDFLTRCVASITANFNSIEAGSGCFGEEGGREDIEVEWICSQITEATYCMELMWQIMNDTDAAPSSRVVLEWFQLLQKLAFLNEFPGVCASVLNTDGESANQEQDEPAIQTLVPPMQAISMMVSMAFLVVAPVVEHLQHRADKILTGEPAVEPYFANTETLTKLNNLMLHAADTCLSTAGPVLLSWSVVLMRINGVVSEQEDPPHPYKDVLERIQGSIDDSDITQYLGLTAVNSCGVFDTLTALCSQLGNTAGALFSPAMGAQMRCMVLALIGDINVGYGPEIVQVAVSAITGGESYWDLLDRDPLPYADDPASHFLEDERLFSNLLRAGQMRFPFEGQQFLALVRALSPRASVSGGHTALTILENMNCYTYTLPSDFSGYTTIQEELNLNSISLTTTVQLFPSRSRPAQYQAAQSSSLVMLDDEFIIPVNTTGVLVSETDPKVACWYHGYSGLRYFGKLLETFLAGTDVVEGNTGMPAGRESVAEIIGILATLLFALVPSGKGGENATDNAIDMLAVASGGLSRQRDITSVIFDIFEEELQSQSSRSGAGVPVEILVSCVQFIHALIPISPGRVWPLLTRCGLLDVGRGRARLPGIVESVELLSGRYDLLLSCCRLYEALVDDFATNAIRRRSDLSSTKSNVITIRVRGSRPKQRHVPVDIPDSVLSKILLAFARYLAEVLESSCTWKFVSLDDRRHLHKSIGASFNNVLLYAYGIDSGVDSDKRDESSTERALVPFSLRKEDKKTKVMEALMPAAQYIVQIFLSASSGLLSFQPLLRSFFDGLETPEFELYPNLVGLWTSQVDTMLCLTKTLLRISSMLETTSQLEAQIFRVSSLVARLYVANDSYRTSVIAIFETLLDTSARNTSEPPSLLGRLGPQAAQSFVSILSDLDRPFSRSSSGSITWRLLSTVMKSRQQWFANYLLTGRTPKGAVKRQDGLTEVAALDRPLLATALDALVNIKDLPKIESLGMLEFVASAQNFWLSTVCNSPRYADFIDSLLEYVGKLKPLGQVKNIDGYVEDCYQTRIAAYVAEILAMHLFNQRQTAAALKIGDLLGNLSYFSRWAAAVPTYSESLHAHLKRNFETMYPGCTVRDLKRTTLEIFPLGKEYFYDISLADKMLSLDQGWSGAASGGGLRSDFESANVNLSLVDAQVSLFQGWKLLTTELSAITPSEPGLQSLLANVAVDCVVANGRSQPPEEIFSALSQTRTDLAIALTQRLNHAKSAVPEIKKLLKAVWKTICVLRGSFERPVPDGDVTYYRSLLKLLYIAIRSYPVVATQKAPAEGQNFGASARMTDAAAIIPTVMDILKHVVSMGFREIASNIHDPQADSSPQDLAILTGILQSCLHIPGIELNHPQIVSLMINNHTATLATKLFSWSVVLAIDGDPIYGEQSILFLLALCSMPAMAEQLAINGLLSLLFSAEIISYYRRPGVSPFAESAGLQRCYSIWTRGILPLLVKLLDAVQAPIAAEVAQFLNQFPLMLAHSEQALDAPETNRIIPRGQPKYITSMICSEVHSMSLLIFILNGFRGALLGTMDIPEVKWDVGGVLENAEFWLGSKTLLREKIIPMGGSEVEMVRMKTAAGDTISGLEQKVVMELMGIRDVLSSIDT